MFTERETKIILDLVLDAANENYMMKNGMRRDAELNNDLLGIERKLWDRLTFAR